MNRHDSAGQISSILQICILDDCLITNQSDKVQDSHDLGELPTDFSAGIAEFPIKGLYLSITGLPLKYGKAGFTQTLPG